MQNPRKTNAKWPLALILSFLAISILSRIFYNGQILGLDYSLYYPDGVCYTAHAYEFSGLSPQEAWNETRKNYQVAELPISGTIQDYRPQACQSVQARVIYPLLSAPFVSSLGLQGMLVVPIAAVLLSFLLIFFALRRLKLGDTSIVIGLFALAASSSFMRWNISNLPESLLLLWSALSAFLLVFVFESKPSTRKTWLALFIVGVVIVISALTKRSAHFWTILFVSFALIYSRSPSLRARIRWQYLTGISALLLTLTWIADRLTGRILGGQNSLWIATTTTTCLKGEQIYANPGNVTSPLTCDQLPQKAAANISNFVITEIGQLAILDKPLFLICGVLIIGVLLTWRAVSDYARICLLVSVFTFGATMLNATLGLNFRLMTPAIPYLIIGAVIVLDKVIQKSAARI